MILGANRKFRFTGCRTHMPPIVKDSDTLTTPETTARAGSAASGDSATRPQPVALEVPITVNGARTLEGSDKREPFSESTKTVMVHGNGAVIKLHSALAPGQLLFLTNERTKKEVVCQVVKSKNYRNVSGYVELEFTEPAVGFWGMRFPGDRIAPGPQVPPEARRPAATNGSPGPAQPVEQKAEQPAASSARKPSTPAPFLPRPPAPVLSGSSIVPAPIDSGTLLGSAYPKADGVSAVRATSLFGREETLVEPWLKKRDPASRVLEPAPSAARPEPVKKAERPAPTEPPVRDFQLARPSDKPASLFAPSEPPSNPATVDLSSLAPFFEVKPSAADIAPAAPQAPAGDPETEELRRHTTRLEEELSQMRFAEPAPSLPAKPALEAPPISEPAISLPKPESVHESAADLLEHPVASSAPAVLPEVRKLEEPLKIEPPAPIPALGSLEEEELKIPAWLAPLARNASAPSSPKELVLREKAKRIAEQPPLEELMAPLAAPLQQEKAAASHVPPLRSARLLEGVQKINENASKKPGQGMLFVALGAGILLLGAGGWWYKNQRSGGVLAGTSTARAKAAGATSQDAQANSSKEAALGAMLPVHKDALTPDAGGANVPGNAAPAGPTDVAARNPRSASNSANGGSAVIIAETAEPGPAPTEKKPVLGEVHLEAPKISPKRTAESSSEPDARAMSEEPQEGDANALGADLASNKPPAPPAAPVAVGGEVRQARLVSTVPPAYPSLARAQHVSGGVTIDALIDANGRVTKMKVLSGPTLLEQAAMDALKQWKYEPAMLDGKAVPMHLTVTIQFRLQ
ncbi:MAG TPA: TonB family protein [Candidatus Acidoferrum sp.]